MTTEIAVLNRLGVALATDSAVTITGSGRTKVFNSADKLFELSCDYPVAIMINGNMDFFGVPWEILVKDFRDAHAKSSFGTIHEWASQFLAFSQAHAHVELLSDDIYVDKIARSEVDFVRGEILDRFWTTSTTFSTLVAKSFLPHIVTARTDELAKMGRSVAHNDLSTGDVSQRYAALIHQVIVDGLKPIDLDASDITILTTQIATAVLTVVKDTESTGLIVAGYSLNQSFPCIYSVDLAGVLDGKIKHTEISERAQVGTGKSGYIVSFAQTDVIGRLLDGVDPRFVAHTATFIQDNINILGEALADLGKTKRWTKAEKAVRASAIEELSRETREKYLNAASQMQGDFRIEYERMIAMMPKIELIELAEALVSITAIERKATADEGTVGGPIDVAFMTRHEGFVWIKRKYYFNAALNPRYFWRKFRLGKWED